MRYTPFSVAIFALLVSAAAAQEAPPRTISVAGTALTRTMPDTVVWHLSLVDSHPDLRRAKRENDERMECVLELRNALRLEAGDLQTGHLAIQREFERDERGNQGAFKHWTVRRSVVIRQRELVRFDEFLDAIMEAAELELYFTLESSRIHDVRAETRLRAMKLAQEKAQALAEAAGAKLGRVLTIDEFRDSGGQRRGLEQNAMFIDPQAPPDEAGGAFAPGAIEERATVYATFELQ